MFKIQYIKFFVHIILIWSPSSLNELTQTIFDMELTHLGSEASIYAKEVDIKRQLSFC